MKSEALYEGLKDLAERLGIQVSEQNFKRLGIRVKGGFCIVKGKPMFLLDKQVTTIEKIELLSEHLSTLATENLYVVPALRQHLNLAQKSGKGRRKPPLDFDHKKFT